MAMSDHEYQSARDEFFRHWTFRLFAFALCILVTPYIIREAIVMEHAGRFFSMAGDLAVLVPTTNLATKAAMNVI
jgi:hypothetical protein